MGPKHSVINDFREMHFLLDIDKLLCKCSNAKQIPLLEKEVDWELVVDSTLNFYEKNSPTKNEEVDSGQVIDSWSPKYLHRDRKKGTLNSLNAIRREY